MTNSITTYRDPAKMPDDPVVDKYRKLTEDARSQRKQKILPKFLNGALKVIEKSAKNGESSANYYGNTFWFWFLKKYPDDDVLIELKQSLQSMGFVVTEKPAGRQHYLEISWHNPRKRF